MPLYEFVCPECGVAREYFAGFDWRNATWYCPDCESHPALRRTVGRVSLKGDTVSKY